MAEHPLPQLGLDRNVLARPTRTGLRRAALCGFLPLPPRLPRAVAVRLGWPLACRACGPRTGIARRPRESCCASGRPSSHCSSRRRPSMWIGRPLARFWPMLAGLPKATQSMNRTSSRSAPSGAFQRRLTARAKSHTGVSELGNS